MKRKTKFSRLTHLIVLVVLLSTSCAIKVSANNNNTTRFKKSLKQVDLNQKTKKLIITGTIVDQKGTPVPFAAVCFKGTTSGCVAAENGTYSIQIPKEANTILEFSSLGYKTQTVTINGRSKIDIILIKEITNLDDVVVTGFQTISKERATGSFSKIASKRLETPSSDISQKLVGSSAGTKILMLPGGDIKLRIRGVTTFSSNYQPLIVIDGFPIIMRNDANPLAQINPNDVESITILKDAAAASIWGAKAANGVVVITTKKAKSGKAQIEFSSFYKIGARPKLSYLSPSVNSADQVNFEKHMFDIVKQVSPSAISVSNPFTQTSQPRSLATTALIKNNQGDLSDADLQTELNRLSNLDNTNQLKENSFRRQQTKQYNFRISGGKPGFYNSISLFYENNNGSTKHMGYERSTINYNNSTNLTKWLKFDLIGDASFEDEDNSGNGIVPYWSLKPYDMLKDSNGKPLDMTYLKQYPDLLKRYDFSKLPNHPYDYFKYSPLEEYSRVNSRRKKTQVRLQGKLTASITKDLSVNTKYYYSIDNRHSIDEYNSKSYEAREFVRNHASPYMNMPDPTDPGYTKTVFISRSNDANFLNPDGYKLYVPDGGAKKRYDDDLTYYSWRSQINYHHTFNNKHALTALAGFEISEQKQDMTRYPDALGYYNDRVLRSSSIKFDPSRPDSHYIWNGSKMSLGYQSAGISADPKYIFEEKHRRTVSMFGNVGYTYNGKYNITASIRNDASNMIADNNSDRYFPFWSIGGSWNISKENFLNNIYWLNRLTIRATVGEAGNFSSNMTALTMLSLGTNPDRYSGKVYNSISDFGNPGLHWERTKTYNLGLDFAVLNSRLCGNIDVYNKKSTDLLVETNIPASNGSSSRTLNTGELYNRGIEISLRPSFPILKNKIVWNGNINFAYNENKVTKLFRNRYSYSDLFNTYRTSSLREGYPVKSVYVYKYAGMHKINGVDLPCIKGPKGKAIPVTDLSSISGDARDYLKYVGTVNNPYLVGLQNSFKIFNFDLSCNITGDFGGKFIGHHYNYPGLEGKPNDLYKEALKYDPSKRISGVITQDNYKYISSYGSADSHMDYNIQSASWIGLQEINLTYTLPKRLISHVGLSRAQVYVQGNNLAQIYFNDYKENVDYPIGRQYLVATYTFGVKINL